MNEKVASKFISDVKEVHNTNKCHKCRMYDQSSCGNSFVLRGALDCSKIPLSDFFFKRNTIIFSVVLRCIHGELFQVIYEEAFTMFLCI